MKFSAGFLFVALATVHQASAFQPLTAPSTIVTSSTTALDMAKGGSKKSNKKNNKVTTPTPNNDYLDTLKQAASTTVQDTAGSKDIEKVATSAKGIGKLFQDLGGEVASLGNDMATSVSQAAAAAWDKQRLNKLQKARLTDLQEEITALTAEWEKCSLEEREQVLEETFTTTFKLLQTVQNQQDPSTTSETMGEDIKDLEALATQRIVLKKTPGGAATKSDDTSKLAP